MLTKVLSFLYSEEVNVCLTSTWDAGWTWSFLDKRLSSASLPEFADLDVFASHALDVYLEVKPDRQHAWEVFDQEATP